MREFLRSLKCLPVEVVIFTAGIQVGAKLLFTRVKGFTVSF